MAKLTSAKNNQIKKQKILADSFMNVYSNIYNGISISIIDIKNPDEKNHYLLALSKEESKKVFEQLKLLFSDKPEI